MRLTRFSSLALLVIAGIAAGLLVAGCGAGIKAYEAAEALLADGHYIEAAEAFDALGAYKDSAARASQARDELYQSAVYALMALKDYGEAAEKFESLGGYRDSGAKAKESRNGILYEAAAALLDEGDYDGALAGFEACGGFGDAKSQVHRLTDLLIPYAEAEKMLAGGDYGGAAEAFDGLGGYGDSAEKAAEARRHIEYGGALAELQQGMYVEAFKKFGELGGFLDSPEKRKEADDAFWRVTLEQGSIAACEKYLELPNTAHWEEASGELKRLYGIKMAAEAEADFAAAMGAGTIAAIESYVSAWADSGYADAKSFEQAAARVSELKEDTGLSAALLGSPDGVTNEMIGNFLRDFPGHVDEQKVKDLKKGDLKTLLASGAISAAVTGGGIQSTNVKLTNNTGRDLTVTIPIGTYFAADSSGVQNMVVRRPETVTVGANGSAGASVYTACMNIEKKIPEESNNLKPKSLEAGSKLAKVVGLCAEKGAPYSVTQAAVWIVTDNPGDSALLNTLVYNDGKNAISAEDLEQAKKIVKEAG